MLLENHSIRANAAPEGFHTHISEIQAFPGFTQGEVHLDCGNGGRYAYLLPLWGSNDVVLSCPQRSQVILHLPWSPLLKINMGGT